MTLTKFLGERVDPKVDFDWSFAAPSIPGLSPDKFSVRWTGNFTFEAGEYAFNLRADDGIRLYVDGTLLVNGWKDQSPTLYQAKKVMTAGTHEVKVEFYENSVTAVAQASWVKTGSVPVQTVQAPLVTISASQASVPTGGSTTLTWSSTNATSCTASGLWSGTKATSGSQSITVNSSGNATISCVGGGGSVSKSVSILAITPVIDVKEPSVTISLSPNSITSGGKSTITWSSSETSSCTASGLWSGNKSTSGTESITPTSSGTVGISCTGQGGVASKSASITVTNPTVTPDPQVPPPTSGGGETGLKFRLDFEGSLTDSAPEGTADQVSGLTLNGSTFPGASSYSSSAKSGSRSLAFNSSNFEYLSVPDSNDISPSGPFTISTWIKPNNWDGNRRVLQKGNDGEQYRFLTEWGSFRFEVNLSGGQSGASTFALPSTGSWHHVVGVYDGSRTYLYIDGSLVGSNAGSGSPSRSSNPLTIGTKMARVEVSGDYWDGSIDDFKIYHRALNGTEVKSLFVVGTPTLNIAGTNGIPTEAFEEENNGTMLASVWTAIQMFIGKVLGGE